MFKLDDHIRIKKEYHRSKRSRIIRSVVRVNDDGSLIARHPYRGRVTIKHPEKYEIVEPCFDLRKCREENNE